MGGYYTLLAAGVDHRIRFGMDELGAVPGANRQQPRPVRSAAGIQDALDQGVRSVFLRREDSCPDAREPGRERLLLLARGRNQNFEALAGEKTLCISPNFNHPDGCYGATKYNPMDWLPYALGHETAYPAIASATQDGATYRVATQPGVTIQNATLYWSPGATSSGQPATGWRFRRSSRTASGKRKFRRALLHWNGGRS